MIKEIDLNLLNGLVREVNNQLKIAGEAKAANKSVLDLSIELAKLSGICSAVVLEASALVKDVQKYSTMIQSPVGKEDMLAELMQVLKTPGTSGAN